MRAAARGVKIHLMARPPHTLKKDKLVEGVGGFRVPRGTLVFVSPFVTQRHPAIWENPEGFDPDLRFLASASGADVQVVRDPAVIESYLGAEAL